MRQDRLTPLRRHLNAVLMKSPGQVLALWGEAGVGKSFALQGLLSETPYKHLSVHSSISMVQLAQKLPRAVTLPDWTRKQLEQVSRGQSLEGQALEDTLAVAISCLSPFVLHIEDVHEANPERLALILKLARFIACLRGVALIASSRAELPAPFRSYRLEPLDLLASDALLEAQVQARLPRTGLDWVFERAQGNALFTLEFWRYLLREGAFWSDGQRWAWREPNADFVPVSVEVLISEQLALNVNMRAVLEARAVLEQPELKICDAVWANVANVSLEQLRTTRTQLEARGLLQGLDFVHPLFREVLAREISLEHQREYARRAVRAFARHPEQAALFIAQADLEPEDIFSVLEAAQKSAEVRGDSLTAAKFFLGVVEHLPEPTRSIRAFEAAQTNVLFDLARAAKLSEISVAGPNPAPKAQVLHAEILARQGQMQLAERILEQLASDPNVRLQRFEALLYVKQLQGKYEEVRHIWDAQPELHDAVDTYALSDICFALSNLEQLEQAEALVEQMFTRQTNDPNALYYTWNMRAHTFAAQEKHADALNAMSMAIQMARALGAPALVAQALNNYAVIALGSSKGLGFSKLEELRPMLQEALTLSRQVGHMRFYSAAQDVLAMILMEEAQFEEAETLLRQGETVFAMYEMLPRRCDNHLDQAALYLDWQPIAGIPLALRHARAGLNLAREIGSVDHLSRALSITTRAEALSRNAELAMRLAQELQMLAEQHPAQTDRSLFALGAALEVNGFVKEARQAFVQSQSEYRQNDSEANAQRAAFEADRIANDLIGARERHAWFLERGLMCEVHVALRHFPEIATEGTAQDALASNKPNLRLKVLGLPQLERDGQVLVYRSKKRLELLCYLLGVRIAGKSEVSVLELAEVFYPDSSDIEAKRTLRQQIYLLRNDLGQQVIHSTTNGYALAAITSDAEQFLRSDDTNLWRAMYLERASEGWDGNVRESLVQALRCSFERLLGYDLIEAVRVGQILLEMEPYDAGLLRLVLQAQHEGDAKAASRRYQQAQERFWEVSETLPVKLKDFLGSVQPELTQGSSSKLNQHPATD